MSTLTSNWARFSETLHFHHKNEDDLVFPPWLAKRAPADAIAAFTGEHEVRSAGLRTACVRCAHAGRAPQALVAQLEACERGFAALRKTKQGGAALAALQADYAAFKDSMSAHLLSEEQVGLPLMRHHYASKDFKPIEAKIREHATPAEAAGVLRPMGTDAARREWMTQVAHIPGPVQALVMMPASRRYPRDVVVPMTALCAGATQAPPPPDAGCACCVM